MEWKSGEVRAERSLDDGIERKCKWAASKHHNFPSWFINDFINIAINQRSLQLKTEIYLFAVRPPRRRKTKTAVKTFPQPWGPCNAESDPNTCRLTSRPQFWWSEREKKKLSIWIEIFFLGSEIFTRMIKAGKCGETFPIAPHNLPKI